MVLKQLRFLAQWGFVWPPHDAGWSEVKEEPETLVLQAAIELHNVGEIQLSPIILGSHVIHHLY